ncbi:MAG: hypothetical protein JO187_12135 [Acidobacteria bacterium]|nr:hypothetical protein [Acidobacteriaceae bacterium]MBV9610298.1 hypothetical protein [Acidobacteriota bacterium]
MTEAIDRAISTRDVFALRQIAQTAPHERSLMLQLIADILEDQPSLRITEMGVADLPTAGLPHSA